jgi:hypothetical protein
MTVYRESTSMDEKVALVDINKRRAAMEKKLGSEKGRGYRGRNPLHNTIISTWNEFRGLLPEGLLHTL